MPPKKIESVDTDSHIILPRTWQETLMYFLHDKFKIFNTIVLLYALVISPFIIFSKNSPELNTVKEINLYLLTTYSTLQFIMFGNTIFMALVVIHANYLLHILWSYLKNKK